MTLLQRLKIKNQQSEYDDWDIKCDANGVAEEIVVHYSIKRISTKDIQSYKIYPAYWELIVSGKKITIRSKPHLLDSIFRGIHHSTEEERSTATTEISSNKSDSEIHPKNAHQLRDTITAEEFYSIEWSEPEPMIEKTIDTTKQINQSSGSGLHAIILVAGFIVMSMALMMFILST